MRQVTLFAIAAIVAFTFFAEASTYGVVVVTTATGSPRNDFGGTIGFNFTVGNTALSVTDLGAYDYGTAGFAYPTQTGLWDNGGNLVASTTFLGGNDTTGTTVIGDYRYQSIAPYTLAANTTYSLGTYYPYHPGIGDIWLGNDVGGDAYSPLITVNGAAYGNVSFVFPGNPVAGTQSFDGPNAIFAIPEPATLGVLVLLLPILSLRRRV